MIIPNFHFKKVLGLTAGEFRVSVPRTAMAAIGTRRVLVGRRCRLVGASNITVDSGLFWIGTAFYGFVDHRAGALIRVRGRLRVSGPVVAAHGNRWDVGPDSTVQIGSGTYFSPNAQLLSRNGVAIGSDCAIGWDCQILDTNLHEHSVGGVKRPLARPISIGNNVWIGARSMILAGAVIADGCVVAAGSRVSGVFDQPKSLIAGSPARVVRSDVSWE